MPILTNRKHCYCKKDFSYLNEIIYTKRNFYTYYERIGYHYVLYNDVNVKGIAFNTNYPVFKEYFIDEVTYLRSKKLKKLGLL